MQFSIGTRGSRLSRSTSGCSVLARKTRRPIGTRRTLLARAALCLCLTSDTEENVQGILRTLGRHVHHLLPHITGTSLAVLYFTLYGGLEGLYIVEHEGEG